jgi:MoaA/NifB/PqqE/SkfB family radical SAM enzyme
MLDWIEAELKLVHHFDVQISLDGIGEVHDWVRGIPGSFQYVAETLDQLVALKRDFPKLRVRLSTVVLPYNLPNLEALQAFASEHGFPIAFTPVILSNEYYDNLQNSDFLTFSSVEQRVQAAEFFLRLARLEQSSLRHHYKDVSRMLLGSSRKRKCMMGFYGFVIEYNGDVYSCVNCEKYSFGNLLNVRFEELWFRPHASYVRQQVHRNCCPTCTSLCYPLPTNLAEVVDIVLRRLIISLLNIWAKKIDR